MAIKNVAFFGQSSHVTKDCHCPSARAYDDATEFSANDFFEIITHQAAYIGEAGRSEKKTWTNPLRGSRDFGRGSDFAGWVRDKHPRLALAGQLNRETMTWRHVALFVSQRSCQ